MAHNNGNRPAGGHPERSGDKGGYYGQGQRSGSGGGGHSSRGGRPGGPGGGNRFQGGSGRGGPRPGGPGGGRFGGGRPGGRPNPHQGGPRGDRFGEEERKRGPKPPKPDIIHKDDSILIVNKPAGIPVLRGPSPTLCEMVDTLTGARRRLMRVAHIIDDTCSGIVLYVATRNSDDSPRDQTHPETTYLALVEGVFDEDKLRTGETVSAPTSRYSGQGATPTSHIRVMESGNGLTLVQVRARPDLQGQIREHLAMIGHPVVGDTQNKSTRDDLHRVGLHAHQIRLVHPEEDGSQQRYKAPPPASFWRAMGKEPPADAAGLEQDTERETQQGWDHVAGWYDNLLQDRGSDHHQRIILPGVTRLLDLQGGERVLDVACGQGIVSEHLAHKADVEVLGVDVSERLIESANERSTPRTSFLVHDAQQLESLDAEAFDAGVCVMALMNIEDLDAVLTGIASKLKPGGRFVTVISHPSFRVMGASSWGWTHDERTALPVQFRRVDRYMSTGSTPIVMNPGEVAKGAPPVTTLTHHRPLSAYINSGAYAGLLLNACEEWVSDRKSEPGPRANAENHAREEIPLFMALRFTKPANN